MEDYMDHKQECLWVCNTHWVMNSNGKATSAPISVGRVLYLALCRKLHGANKLQNSSLFYWQ